MAPPKTYHHPELKEVSLASVMQALADPCRLAIVRTLASNLEHEFACNEFDLDLCKATVSHHFEVLREAGIISTRVEGRKCLSSLRDKELDQRFPGLLRARVKWKHNLPNTNNNRHSPAPASGGKKERNRYLRRLNTKESALNPRKAAELGSGTVTNPRLAASVAITRLSKVCS